MKKWHKWLGLFFAIFMFMFALSGIFLNHRRAISSVDVPRSALGSTYSYDNWNKGSVKGSFKLSGDSILLYGGNGIWLTDSLHSSFIPFTKGIKSGADNNIINNIVKTSSGEIFSVSTFDIYRLNPASGEWISLSGLIDSRERFSDICVQGDSLVLMTRSHFYVSTSPYTAFSMIELPTPEGYKKEASWFRTLWTLHSGELFGMPGKIIVDIMGVFTIILCVTGVILTFCPKLIRRMKKKGKEAKKNKALFKTSLKWHNKLGSWFFAIFLIVVISGMFLRPPLLISIIRGKSKPIPGTMLDSDNPWHDKLRCIRYDTFENEWIFYSSDGFFQTKSLDIEPRKMKKSPPVSIMGVNVLNQQDSINWVVGSFSGIYRWNKQTGESFDYYTDKPYQSKRGGMPTFTNSVGGYSDDFADKTIVFEYGTGAKVIESGKQFTSMPDSFRNARMSLWHLSLEVHVGRIYTFLPGIIADLFVFISGILSLIILITGYIIYRKYHKRKKKKKKNKIYHNE
ncbi:PepSY-associated TM helix domain-containing protein [Dysgonomonas sp. 511]|uniref:PepSY-associated TM helix domain-containing protein n=1 Tax=Dysgonomonas sp. 511 TaxID=2302930 RepID=UPI0013D39EA9|nr:PepSY-associated TM helix domain-containing protein [Dysgonomonas sp. 511]NDV78960.1 PepSY domain-containing protein [Dysgonomonas sp. 511]